MYNQLTKKQRLSAYKVSRLNIENLAYLDGLCWTLARPLQDMGISCPSGHDLCPFISSFYPEFELFTPSDKRLWWFNIPETGINEDRLCRLIILDFCIEMLS